MEKGSCESGETDDRPWGPKGRGERMAGWQTWLTGRMMVLVTEGRAQGEGPEVKVQFYLRATRAKTFLQKCPVDRGGAELRWSWTALFRIDCDG